MPLKNSQYNTILRAYDQRQLEDAHRLSQHRQEAYAAIPALKGIEEEIAATSAQYARSQIQNAESATTRMQEYRQQMEKLKSQKASLLKSHGFPDDYLSLTYQCKDCKDTGFIGNEKCHCFKQAIVDLVYAQSNCKDRMAEENFQTFRLDYYSDQKDMHLGISPRQNMENILKNCREFIANFDSCHENILFYGNTGVGKTFLANCIAKELLDQAHTVIYLTAFDLVDVFERHQFGQEEEEEISDDLFDYVLDCDLLIIDDLGTEMNNSFVSSQLFLCINERLLRKKSTIISTNMSVEKLQKEYSERISSRIISYYKILPVIGEDIRVQKAIRS